MIVIIIIVYYLRRVTCFLDCTLCIVAYSAHLPLNDRLLLLLAPLSLVMLREQTIQWLLCVCTREDNGKAVVCSVNEHTQEGTTANNSVPCCQHFCSQLSTHHHDRKAHTISALNWLHLQIKTASEHRSSCKITLHLCFCALVHLFVRCTSDQQINLATSTVNCPIPPSNDTLLKERDCFRSCGQVIHTKLSNTERHCDPLLRFVTHKWPL